MNLKDFQLYLQVDFLKDRTVSKWFAHTFLLSLGWHYKRQRHQKSTYYGSHERPDVKEAREVFLTRMKQLEKSACKNTKETIAAKSAR